MEGPVMRADDDEKRRVYEMSSDQSHAMKIMAVIQIIMIIITAVLFVAQTVTSINFGLGAIATIIVYLVIYLNFVKLAGYIADIGIKVRWIKALKVLSPILFFTFFILCVITIA